MKIIRCATWIVALSLLVVGSAHSQQTQTLNTDILRDQINRLESISVEGKSNAIKTAHRRALLSVYKQFQSALRQEMEDLSAIQKALGTSDVILSRQNAANMDRLSQERDQLTLRIQDLSNALRASEPVDVAATVSPSVSASINDEALISDKRAPDASVGPASNATGSVTGLPPAALTSLLPAFANVTAPISKSPFQTSTSLNADLNNRVKEAARAKIQQRETTKQAEPPSSSNSSASLVDTSSAGDLVNLGLSLAGITSGSDATKNTGSVSVTTSAYALFAASQDMDPLNPGFYNRNSGWRKLSFTLGYDDEKLKTGQTQRAHLFGTKYLIVDKRDPARNRHKSDFQIIGDNLQKAAVAFGNLDERVSYYFTTNKTVKDKLLIPQFKIFLNERLKTLQGQTAVSAADTARIDADKARISALLDRVDTGRLFILDSNGLPPNRGQSGEWSREELEFYSDSFRSTYLGPDYRAKLKDAVGQKVLDDLDAFISKQLVDTKAFEDLSDSTRESLQRIRRAPQFSFYFLTKQRPEGDDEYTGETIFDYGVADRINLTLNANFKYTDSKLIGGDTRGGKFSGQFRFQMTPEKLAGRNPLFLSISGNGEKFNGKKPAYHAQAKLTIPILNGLDLPFSFTYANQSGLIKEKKIKGQFGFSIDTARLLQALTAR
jgi:hypothetical protein